MAGKSRVSRNCTTKENDPRPRPPSWRPGRRLRSSCPRSWARDWPFGCERVGASSPRRWLSAPSGAEVVGTSGFQPGPPPSILSVRASRSPAAGDGPDLPAEVVLQRLEQADTYDSRAVAARLWDLDALAARYRLVLAQTQVLTAQAGQHAPGAAADDPTCCRRNGEGAALTRVTTSSPGRAGRPSMRSLPAETVKFSVSHAAEKGMPLVRREPEDRPCGVPAVANADLATGQARHLDAIAVGVAQRALNPVRTRTQPFVWTPERKASHVTPSLIRVSSQMCS